MKKFKIIILFFIVVSCFVSFSRGRKDDGKKASESFPDGESQKFGSLERFHKAQTQDLLQVVEKELTEGKVKTCYMWYIFPQIHGLGQSEKTKYYSIKSLKEAKSYLDDKVLRERLVRHTKLVLNHRRYKTIWKIFDEVDARKFISCMTLFSIADPKENVFADALRYFNGGDPDTSTLRILGL